MLAKRLPSETFSNKNHANRHLQELFGVIRSTIDPHLPLSKQPIKHRLHSFSSTFHIKKVNPPNKTHQKYRCENCHTTRDSVDLFFLRTSTMPFGLGIFFGLRLHPPRWYLFRFDHDTLGFQTPAFIVSLFLGVVSLCFSWRGWCSFLCPCVFVVFFLLLGVCCFFGLFFWKGQLFEHERKRPCFLFIFEDGTVENDLFLCGKCMIGSFAVLWNREMCWSCPDPPIKPWRFSDQLKNEDETMVTPILVPVDLPRV